MAGKTMKMLLCLLLCGLLLPCAVDAAAPLPAADGPVAQCLASLAEWEQVDAVICMNKERGLLISFSGEDAFAAVRMEDTVALVCFYLEDDAWQVAWINDYHPFGVDENGADLQPEYLRFNGGTLTWCATGETEKTEVTATYDGWEWFVTGLTRHVLAEGTWQLIEQRDEVIALLAGFSLHQEGEPEPVVIEGNTLVSYPQDRMDAHYTVPEGIEIIGEGAFCGNEWLVHVTLPESVRIIEDDAFADCWNLRRVDMPSVLEYLGWGAFAQTWVNCTIPEGLTELPPQTFCSAGMEGTVVIPEGVTDIGYECFAFGFGITDLYLPASLQTIGGETFQQGAEFWKIWCFNSVDAGETHMTVHAPAGTEAERFARWSGEAFVIEDAREGTDLAAVTGWVEEALAEILPGAKVCENEYGFPCVTYSADTVFAFAMKERATRYDKDDCYLCCFDRSGNELTLRWVNEGICGNDRWTFLETPVPLDMVLVGDKLHLMFRLGEETAAALTFAGEDFRLAEADICVWEKDRGGAPPAWDTRLSMPITDGAPLREFTVSPDIPREQVVQGAVFDGDTVLLSVDDVITAAGLDYVYQDYINGVAHFEVGEHRYVLNEQAMSLTLDGDASFNLILPAPGSTDFRSEIIDGRWMVDADTVYCTFRTFLGWPIRIRIDHDAQTVTVCPEK